MNRPPRSSAFTLIEMIVVIGVIMILIGMVFGLSKRTTGNSAKEHARVAIRVLVVALENYKTDNGGYPQDPVKTDALDARDIAASESAGVGSKYAGSSLYLYECLSGDTNHNGVIDAGETARNYATDFFKPSRLYRSTVNGSPASVEYLMDPFGNSYGYSTAGLLLEQEYRGTLATDPGAPRPATNSQGTRGYSSTFDLWSTAGDTRGDPAKWAKSW
jgi:type II secretory pathway pseudopilin PulG